MEIFLLHQVGGDRGHQTDWWLGLKQDHEGQHAYLMGKVLLQEHPHGNVLHLKTRFKASGIAHSDVQCKGEYSSVLHGCCFLTMYMKRRFPLKVKITRICGKIM